MYLERFLCKHELKPIFCYIAVLTLLGFEDKFWIQSKSTSQGLPYDFSSIMHFRHNAFSRIPYKSTVVPRNRTVPKTILGSSSSATDIDFRHLNLLYCGGTDAKFIYALICRSWVRYVYDSLNFKMEFYFKTLYIYETISVEINTR